MVHIVLAMHKYICTQLGLIIIKPLDRWASRKLICVYNFHYLGLFVQMKALLGEICDDTNSSFAMTIAMSSYSIGLILGPAIGGACL